MSAQAAEAAKPAARPEPYRVLVVDDSAIIRAIITRLIAAEPRLTLAGTAANGQLALQESARLDPDLIVMDVEMPVMDGITALPKLVAADPLRPVIMCSTLTKEGAEVTIRALEFGAADFIAKPTSEVNAAEEFKRDLVAKMVSLGSASRLRRLQRRPNMRVVDATPARTSLLSPTAPISLSRTFRPQAPDAIAIGSSTGGPQALLTLMAKFDKPLRQPVFITQHMPPTFTQILADHIGQRCAMPSAEARDGDVVQGGRIYLAPGNYHMLVEAKGAQRVLRLTQTPPENFCRPAVDVMLRSLVETYSGAMLIVMLTGMGHDGLAGSQACVQKGASVIAQDEASSVVWGMPGAVAKAGICRAVLPLERIAEEIKTIAGGTRS